MLCIRGSGRRTESNPIPKDQTIPTGNLPPVVMTVGSFETVGNGDETIGTMAATLLLSTRLRAAGCLNLRMTRGASKSYLNWHYIRQNGLKDLHPDLSTTKQSGSKYKQSPYL